MKEVDEVIERSLPATQVPGAVVCIGNSREITYLKAYGRRAVVPAPEEMTTDTLFDMSSCTKSLATATAVMILVDRRQLALEHRVAKYLPSFGVNGKAEITVADLLLHIGGLQRENDLRHYADGKERSFDRIMAIAPAVTPRTMFGYSDLGHLVLGRLIEVVGGRKLGAFAREEIFSSLSMCNTMFSPPNLLKRKCAPTDQRHGQLIRGEVRDPRSHALGGVAGHAGLFSTAEDVGNFCRMILRKGELNDRRILSESAVNLMTTPQKLPGGGSRAYGFDVDTAYGVDTRGRRFERGSTFGHSGAAGVSFWIDPANDCFFTLLTNSAHPDGQGKIRELRHTVSTQIGYSLLGEPKPVMVHSGTELLRGSSRRPPNGRVGIYTNQTIESASGVCDAIPVGADESLESLDVLMIDIQDVGARFFGELKVLRSLMVRAAHQKIRIICLDRLNPNSGMLVGGPIAQEPGHRNGLGPIPIIHGLTVGELAKLINVECEIGCSLEVLPMEGWQRTMDWADTDRKWIPPSADLRTPEAAAAFTAIGLLEDTNVSLAQGTHDAYQFLGAPWIDGVALLASLNNRDLPGIRFTFAETRFDRGQFARQQCSGVRLQITDRRAVQPVRTGITLAWELRRLFGSRFDIEAIRPRLCSDESFTALLQVPDPAMLLQLWRLPLQAYRRMRDKYLIYQ